MEAMANHFTYDIQQAGYDFDQYDLKGEATYDKFITEFRNFPWKEQVEKSKEGTSEPSLAVKNSVSKIDCWVSVIGTSKEFAYLVGIVYPKKVKTFFVFGKEKEVRWVEAFIVEEKKEVEELFKLYFDGKIEELKSKLAQHSLFLSQKAR
jgi:hypothetical protein